MPMKFDAARANAIFEKLGDPAFTGPNNEGHVADFVAGEFERIGWQVERREVEGSRFPQRAGPWIGWLGYGALITVGYVLMLGNGRVSVVLAFLSFAVAWRWVDALLNNRIRLGRRRKPLEAGPLLIGSLTGESPPAVRVVFQAVLGGLKTDFFQSFRRNRVFINQGFKFFDLVCNHDYDLGELVLWATSLRYQGLDHFRILCAALDHDSPHSFLGGSSVAAGERSGSSGTAWPGCVARTARSWPRNRSRQIEPVFIAAGGQRLDYAGSREVVRILETEWPRKPTLLVLFFAPGAGEAIRNRPGNGRLEEAREGVSGEPLDTRLGRRLLDAFLRSGLSRDVPAAETIALIGSDPTTFFDSSVVPEALRRGPARD